MHTVGELQRGYATAALMQQCRSENGKGVIPLKDAEHVSVRIEPDEMPRVAPNRARKR